MAALVEIWLMSTVYPLPTSKESQFTIAFAVAWSTVMVLPLTVTVTCPFTTFQPEGRLRPMTGATGQKNITTARKAERAFSGMESRERPILV